MSRHTTSDSSRRAYRLHITAEDVLRSVVLSLMDTADRLADWLTNRIG